MILITESDLFLLTDIGSSGGSGPPDNLLFCGLCLKVMLCPFLGNPNFSFTRSKEGNYMGFSRFYHNGKQTLLKILFVFLD